MLLDEHSGRDICHTAGSAAVPELQHAGADHEIPADLCEIDRDLVEAAGSILGPFLPFHIFLTILQFIGSIKMIYMGQSTEPIFFD